MPISGRIPIAVSTGDNSTRPEWQAEPVEGRDAVERFVAAYPMARGRRWPSVQVSANGQLAFAHYLRDRSGGAASPHSICVIELDGERIAGITSFLMPRLFATFGLDGPPAEQRPASAG